MGKEARKQEGLTLLPPPTMHLKFHHILGMLL